MINSEEFKTSVENIAKNNKDIFIKQLSTSDLKTFHKIITECFKELDIIVKGSRALNKFIKYSLYSKEELIYVDYDFYTKDHIKDLNYIVKKFEESSLKYIKCLTLPFKSNILRLFIYNIPVIDIENISKNIYDKIKIKNIGGIKYVHPEYYKIDLYSVLAQPTYINMNVYEKVYKRIDLLESNYKYKSKYNHITGKGPTKDMSYVLSILNKKTIIVGDYAYNKIIKKNIKINYIELLTDDIYYYINKLKSKYGKRIFYKKCDKILYTISNSVIIYLDKTPLVILWNLINNTSYTVKNSEKLCSRYYLRFYYNFLSFYNSYYPIFYTKDYYYALLNTIKIKSLPKLKSLGNINSDAKEQFDNIRNGVRKDFFRYDSTYLKKPLLHNKNKNNNNKNNNKNKNNNNNKNKNNKNNKNKNNKNNNK